jgi:hypothetical protein
LLRFAPNDKPDREPPQRPSQNPALRLPSIAPAWRRLA